MPRRRSLSRALARAAPAALRGPLRLALRLSLGLALLGGALAGAPAGAGAEGGSGTSAGAERGAGTSADGGAPPGPDAGGSGCAEALARKVQARYETISDLHARFRQRSFSVAFGESGSASEARGEVRFAKPGRMRWVYESPQPSLVVSDGDTLWIHDPTAEEVQVMDVGQGFLSGTAIQFLLGEGDLLSSFRVRAEDCGEPTVRLVLTPRQEATYEQLDLVVEAASGLVQATTVHDLFGNRTHVELEDVRLDTGPEASLFRFEPPEGTRVLEVK